MAHGGFGAACHSEYEGAVDPVDALKALLRQVREFGGEVRYPFEADGLMLEGGRVTGIRAGEASLAADTVVLAPGIATERLAHLGRRSTFRSRSRGACWSITPQPRLIDRVVLRRRCALQAEIEWAGGSGVSIVAGVGSADGDMSGIRAWCGR